MWTRCYGAISNLERCGDETRCTYRELAICLFPHFCFLSFGHSQIDTDTDTDTQTQTHTHIDSNSHPTQTDTLTDRQTCIQTRTPDKKHILTHTQAFKLTYTNIHIYIRTYTHRQTNRYTCSCTHTRTKTEILGIVNLQNMGNHDSPHLPVFVALTNISFFYTFSYTSFHYPFK